MLSIPGVAVKTLLYESTNSLVYRAIREADNQPVILKLLKESYPTPQELVRYRTEYRITKELKEAGVVQVYGLQKYQNTLVMFVEDFGGESLKIWMQQRQFSLKEFLVLAIAITEILGQIHAANIIHKDINPSNIVFNPGTGELKIIDFGISTQLTRETPTLKNPNVLEGTLAYMSPEQTGRMNRSLDYRTDFYSLGVTFYELLTYQLPFETIDALELVHCHIAKQPLLPSEVNGEIPKVISDIVMKLMAKTAEERYQNAFGIKADLEECLKQLINNRKIANFPLALQDISDKFQLPQKLYGREQEIDSLLGAFERVVDKSELMLIAGYSGIGKSALVQELYKPITQKRGYFISGKFDQYQRNIPYSAVVSAFRELIKQLLTESEAQLNQWRQKLLEVLGINGQVIVDVIPEIELIINKQPRLIELGSTEAQNRFNLVFKDFIKVFTKPEHPLTIFIDDLQWADGASLKLMQLLMAYSSPGLFLIGAYRDNEVSVAHPLMLTLDEIAKNGTIINRISLSPLNLVNITQILGDTLNSEEEMIKPLAELLQFKTGGNPFFMNEFLKSLYTERLLKFCFVTRKWQWSLTEIQGQGFTDNVVELMAGKIQKLPESTQVLLKLAACIGNQFDLKIVGAIASKSLKQTASELYTAVAESLVMPRGKIEDLQLDTHEELSLGYSLEYQFIHDRIQQAAYSLIPESDKPLLHQQIGKLLLQNTPDDKREEKIFDIVNQLNFTIELISEGIERYELAQLNLIAGKKAKASAAYEPALNCFIIGLKLLPEDSWDRQYSLALALHLEAAEAAYLKGDFEQMEKLVKIVQIQAKTLLDRSQAIEIRIPALIAQSKLEEALDTGIEILKQLRVKLPKKPNKLSILMGLLETNFALWGKQIDDLANLPEMSAPYQLAAMRILSRITSSAYIAAPQLLPLIAFKQVFLSVKYGNSNESIYAYATYGLILCGVIGDIVAGYQFGELALKLLERSDSKQIKTSTLETVYGFIKHWRGHLKETLIPLLEAYKNGRETGDLEFASYSALIYCYHSYLMGKELTEVEREIANYSHATSQLQQETASNFIKIYWQSVLNLRGHSESGYRLIGEAYDEKTLLPICLAVNNRTAILTIYLNKMMLCYLFEEYHQACEFATLTERYLDGMPGTILIPVFYFYAALSQLSVAEYLKLVQKIILLKQIGYKKKKLNRWADFAPENYLHKYTLVKAELNRIIGKDVLAMECYDRAISLAKENEYIHEAAIAYELAAKFYLSKGKELTARTYMQEARYL